jgi:hypothetical protein
VSKTREDRPHHGFYLVLGRNIRVRKEGPRLCMPEINIALIGHKFMARGRRAAPGCEALGPGLILSAGPYASSVPEDQFCPLGQWCSCSSGDCD